MRAVDALSTERTLINPAVWVDENQIASHEILTARSLALSDSSLRLVFPARLTEDKGTEVHFRAIEILENRAPKVQCQIDIVGDGPLEERCQRVAKSRKAGNIRVAWSGPTAYGPEFFQLLREYHGAILANLQSEQPRIVFDAFSQGLGLIASGTSGIQSITRDGVDAFLFEPGDDVALSNAIAYFAEKPGRLSDLGTAGWKSMPNWTHTKMHDTRLKFLKENLVSEA